MAFRCSACGSDLETQEALDAHARQEHQAEGTGGFSCTCGLEFESQEALVAHARADHAA